MPIGNRGANSDIAAAALKEQLRGLRAERRARQKRNRIAPRPRTGLKPSERQRVLAKTAGRCHICGGEVGAEPWQADHVLAHSAGGTHDLDNYLPAHSLCNSYRWDYSAEEFQWVLKIGVWARLQMEKDSAFSRELQRRFVDRERGREKRRKSTSAPLVQPPEKSGDRQTTVEGGTQEHPHGRSTGR